MAMSHWRTPGSVAGFAVPAKAAATTAIELDPTLPQAVFALGVIKGYHDWDWIEGERDLRRAIELTELRDGPLSPGVVPGLAGADAGGDRGTHQGARRRPSESLHTAWLGELYRMDKQYDKAITEVHKRWNSSGFR